MDIEHAKKAFERYLDQYDREDDKIKLKIVHTYGGCPMYEPDYKENGAFQRRKKIGGS